MKSTFESLKESLSRLNLYDFDNTNISNEIKAYSYVIDELNEDLCTMLRECFIETAQTYGLSNRETIIGAKVENDNVESRRKMLMLRESINQSSFTVEKIKESLKSFGLECKVIEYPSLYTVVIDTIGDYPEEKRVWISSEINKIMPAHLNVEVIFNGATWELSDSKDNTFSYIDSLDKTWEEIDNY